MTTLPTFRTAQCSICSTAYFGNGIQDALRQHHAVEGHELTTRIQPGLWTGGVYVVVTNDATGAPVTNPAQVAHLMGIHYMMSDLYPFEIEADDQARGGWLVTVDADEYSEASEEGGFEFYIDGHRIEIPMN